MVSPTTAVCGVHSFRTSTSAVNRLTLCESLRVYRFVNAPPTSYTTVTVLLYGSDAPAGIVWLTSNVHVSEGSDSRTKHPAGVACVIRSPSLVSLMLIRSRSGVSSDDRLSMVNVYVTSSPIFDNVSPVFVTEKSGWNRLTLCESLRVYRFVNAPPTSYTTVTVLLYGSDAPAGIVWLTLNVHVSEGSDSRTKHPAVVACVIRSPSLVSLMLIRSRSGVSSDDRLSMVNVYVTSSPIFDNVSPVFVTEKSGWNRFTEWASGGERAVPGKAAAELYT